jgi:Protein of unknown function (DUF820).
VSEGKAKVSVVKAVGIDEVVLPTGALDLWERGDLHDLLHLPHDGTKVEIVNGTIVVTAAPYLGHDFITGQIARAVLLAQPQSPSWEVLHNTGILCEEVLGGYIPDMVVVEPSLLYAAAAANARRLAPDEIEMVVEVTSKRNAAHDRKPSGELTATKWTGYARMEIPYYLLIDRDPEVARTTLYSIPDRSTGAYLNEESWAFGETIHLPEPFGLSIPAELWRTWA